MFSYVSISIFFRHCISLYLRAGKGERIRGEFERNRKEEERKTPFEKKKVCIEQQRKIRLSYSRKTNVRKKIEQNKSRKRISFRVFLTSYEARFIQALIPHSFSNAPTHPHIHYTYTDLRAHTCLQRNSCPGFEKTFPSEFFLGASSGVAPTVSGKASAAANPFFPSSIPPLSSANGACVG